MYFMTLIMTLTNRCHIDGVVCNAYDGAEDHRADPVNRRAARRPRKANEANRKAGSREEKPPEPRFVLGALVVGLGFALSNITSDGGDEAEPGKEVPNTDGDERETGRGRIEAPLLVLSKMR